MWTLEGNILANTAIPQRSTTVDTGFLPGRLAIITTVGFTGTISLQTSEDGGLSWNNCYRTATDGTGLSNASITYGSSSTTQEYLIRSVFSLFSINVDAASAGKVSASFYSGDSDQVMNFP